MAMLERTYVVPLRKEWLKVPRYKRAKKAAHALREFLQKHMKSENVKLLKELNLAVWVHGMRNPPHHLKVTTTKDDKGVVRANLFGKPVAPPAPKEKAAPAKEAAKAEHTHEEKKPEAHKAAEAKAEHAAPAHPKA